MPKSISSSSRATTAPNSDFRKAKVPGDRRRTNNGEGLLDRARRCDNEEGYKPYAAANPAIFKKFGGRFVVRGGKFENPEGSARSRNVVIEFPDYAAALACYRSPEYQANIKLRQPHAVADIVIIEGYDGPQP